MKGIEDVLKETRTTIGEEMGRKGVKGNGLGNFIRAVGSAAIMYYIYEKVPGPQPGIQAILGVYCAIKTVQTVRDVVAYIW